MRALLAAANEDPKLLAAINEEVAKADNADGSLTLYVQYKSPGKDKESNWLPAPKGADFSLYVRAYWPKPAITSGKWTPPPVLRA